jgi:hypothetical protein
MTVGHDPPIPVISDTVPSQSSRRNGSGVLVDTGAIDYKAWLDGRGALPWHTRREMALPRMDYGWRWPCPSPLAPGRRVKAHRNVRRAAKCNSV